MKKWMKWIITLALLTGGGYWYYTTRIAASSADTVSYDLATVESRTLRVLVESTGEIQPRNRLDVKPPIDGRLERLLIDEGDSVDKGQIIGWISSTERATLLDTASATGEEELAYWQDLFKPTPLISPLKGAIIARNFEPGQSISANDPVVVIADDLIMVASLDETDIGLIQLGQNVDARLEAYPDLDFSGIVEKIAYDAVLDIDITMYEVDVRADNLPAVARSGMTVNLNFIIKEKRDALAVPVTAVLQLGGRGPEERGADREAETYVLVPGELPDQPEQQPVVTGIDDGAFIEILSGLEEGEEILIQTIKLGSGGASGVRGPFGTGMRR